MNIQFVYHWFNKYDYLCPSFVPMRGQILFLSAVLTSVFQGNGVLQYPKKLSFQKKAESPDHNHVLPKFVY